MIVNETTAQQSGYHSLIRKLPYIKIKVFPTDMVDGYGCCRPELGFDDVAAKSGGVEVWEDACV